MSAPLPPLESYVAMDGQSAVRAGIGEVSYLEHLAHQLTLRIGMTDYKGDVLLDSYVFVNPKNVVDYLSSVSGILPGHLVNAPTFETLQPTIHSLLKGRILVGHAVYNDLKFVGHRHPYEDVRDTSLYYPLRQRLGIGREGEYPGLKKLYKEVFGEYIQIAAHDPVEDARATMRLFMSVREEYEMALANSEDCVAGIPRSYELCYL